LHLAVRRTRVTGLKTASFCDPPQFRPTIRKTKRLSCRRGLQYERRVAEELMRLYADVAEVKAGPWIRYTDAAGETICQPDVLIIPNDPSAPIVIVECKLSHRPKAQDKLSAIYGVVVAGLYPDRPQRHVQVCRSLRRGRGQAASNDIDDLLDQAEKYRLVHWF
jgi:hypothetical protein